MSVRNYRWIAPVLVLVLVVLSACAPGGNGAEEQALQERPPVPVEVAVTRKGDLNSVYTYSGEFQAKESLQVAAMVGGKIESILVDEGDEVKAGDVIAELEKTTFEAQLKQAEAALQTAQASLAKMKRGTRQEQLLAAEAALQLARANMARVDNMSESMIEAAAAGVAQAQSALKQAQAEYDKIKWAGQVGEMPQTIALEQATLAYDTAYSNYEAALKSAPIERLALEATLLQVEAQLAIAKDPFLPEDFEMAEAGVKQAEAAVALAKQQLEYATVRAPFDGVIESRFVSVGSAAGPQVPIVSLVSRDIEVVINVEEGRIAEIEKGMPASMRLTAYPGQDFPGVVASVSPTASSSSRSFTVKVQPAQQDGLLKSGMFTEVSLLVDEKKDVLVIPQTAISQVDGQITVYVLTGKDEQEGGGVVGLVEKREITTGLRSDMDVEVLSGLSEGEEVVVAGQSNLAEGSRVKVVSMEEVSLK